MAYRARVRVLASVVCSAVLISIGGLIGALLIKSPSQQASEAQPPAPTVLTVAVTRQVVSKAIIMRGTVTDTDEQQVSVAASTGATVPIITRVVATPGYTLQAGDVLAEISGRPLIALAGSIPAYRDLRPGDQGSDIAQLQQALAALGFADGDDVRGTFGPGTKAAVQALYSHLGYDVPTTSGPDNGGASANDTGASALDAAQDNVTQAQRKLDDLLRTAPDAAAQNSGSSGTPLSLQITYARQDLGTAQRRYQQIQAATGPMMPLSEMVFVSRFPAQVVTSSAVVGQAVKSPLITLSTGAPAVVGRMDPADASFVRAGMAVTIDAEAAGIHESATVASLGSLHAASTPTAATGESSTTAANSAEPSDSAVYLPVTVTPTTTLPYALVGQDVRVTVTSASTGSPVLAVPEAAITVTASGTSSVIKLTQNGAQVTVAVTVGITGDGLVQVTPTDAGQLSTADKVVTSQ